MEATTIETKVQGFSASLKPDYKVFSWWQNEKHGRIFILIGMWYNDIDEERLGWRIQLAEAGKEKPVIISLAEWETQLKNGNIKEFFR